MVGWRAAGGVDLGGRGAGRRLFRAVWGLAGWCWSVWVCGARAKGAEFGGGCGASATVRSLAFCSSPLRSRRQSPHAVCSCARFWWLISATQGDPFGMTDRFWPEGPLVWSRFGAPSPALALFSLLFAGWSAFQDTQARYVIAEGVDWKI